MGKSGELQRVPLLTNSSLVIRDQMREEGGVLGSQPINTAVQWCTSRDMEPE
jgi:hypothetical protein